MADISKIVLPNGNIYNVKDIVARNAMIHTVIGTQVSATNIWTGALQSVDALYNGLTIAYWLPYDSSDNVTLNLTLKNGTTGNINCYYTGNTRLATQYKAGDMIILTYWGQGALSINGVATTDARWIAVTQNLYGTNEVVIAENTNMSLIDTSETKIWIEI